jgi:hypothetical protein
VGSDFDRAIGRLWTGQVTAVDAAADLVSSLTEEEKLWLLDGDQAFWSMGRLSRYTRSSSNNTGNTHRGATGRSFRRARAFGSDDR